MRIVGSVAKLGAIVAVALGAVSLGSLWTPIGIIAGLVLMIVGSTLAPRRRGRAPCPSASLYARDGKPYGPQVVHQSLPRPGASWMDGA